MSPPINRVLTPQRRGPNEFAFPLLVLERHIEGLGEILPEMVARSSLQGPRVLHHGLDAIGLEGAGELLGFGLHPLDHRHRHELLGEGGVDVQHPPRLLVGLRLGGMGGVPLLPEELRGAQEEPRAHLPSHHIGPLVDQDGQVAVGHDPLAVHVPDDRLRGRAHVERLFELLAAAVSHHRAFRGEPLHVLGLPLHEALGNEEREVGVHMAGVLEHPVQGPLHLLPDGVSVGADDHASPHRGVLGQLGLGDDVAVPT